MRRGHANLLCDVPILTDDPRRESSRLYDIVLEYTISHEIIQNYTPLYWIIRHENVGVLF